MINDENVNQSIKKIIKYIFKINNLKILYTSIKFLCLSFYLKYKEQLSDPESQDFQHWECRGVTDS